jgi:hypothetical protein
MSAYGAAVALGSEPWTGTIGYRCRADSAPGSPSPRGSTPLAQTCAQHITHAIRARRSRWRARIWPTRSRSLEVTYATTSVDNGRLVMDPTQSQGNCYLGSVVTPTTQTFTAIDELPYWDSNRCPYNCNTGGTSVTLYYQ